MKAPKINFKKTEEVVSIFKAMGSTNKETARNGFEAFAAFVGPVADTVFQQKDLISGIFQTQSFDFDEEPSIPINPFYNNTEGLFDIWANSVEGGLGYNEVYGEEDYRFKMMRLDSAIAFSKRYLRAARLNQFNLTIQRLFQEILVKRNHWAWNTLLIALGTARFNGNQNLIASSAKIASSARNLLPEDFSRLQTFYDLLRPSWVGGTVDGEVGGITDMFMSPQGFEKLRAWAYNPVNTTAVPDTAESTVLALPDNMRERIFQGANTGTFEYQGVVFHKLLELGPGKPFNLMLDAAHTATGADVTFNGGTEDVVIAINRNADAFWRATRSNESGNTFTLEEDDQFTKREDKVGMYGMIEEGWVVLDKRNVTAIVW